MKSCNIITCNAEQMLTFFCKQFQSDHYEPFLRDEILVDPRPSHVCADKKAVLIHAIDEHGTVCLVCLPGFVNMYIYFYRFGTQGTIYFMCV